MRAHVVLPGESAELEASSLVRLARLAEELGYGGVWLPDHLLPPQPYSKRHGGVYEPIVALSYIAAATTELLLGTTVVVLPLREPVLLAKQAATLDRLSGGRFVLGVGVGWDEEEFANLRAPFADRGRRADEALELLGHLFSGEGGPFHGERFGYERGVFAPRPSDRLVVMTGGTSPAALRRAARFAGMWQGLPGSVAQFADQAETVRASAGRPVVIGARTEWDGASAAQAAAEARAYAAAGADQLAVWFGAAGADQGEQYAERMTRYAREVGVEITA